MPEISTYDVTVGILVPAEDPLKAAKAALASIIDNGDIFTYTVTDGEKTTFVVDLLTEEVTPREGE